MFTTYAISIKIQTVELRGVMKAKKLGLDGFGFLKSIDMPKCIYGTVKSITSLRLKLIVNDATAISAS